MLIIFAFLVCVATAEPVNQTLWNAAVEEILATVSLGPLKKEFTPDYVAKRSREQALKAQVLHFRAQVATSIVECITNKVTVCPMRASISHEAVETVANELKERGFEDVFILKDWCLLIHVPPPGSNLIE